MRFLKIASAKNPENDYILLNGGYFDKKGNKNTNFEKFEGFLCTQFQTLGISRKIEHLAIKNRQIFTSNKPDIKKYNLVIEIFSKYADYETKYIEFISFFDRNKSYGFRLYYRPYEGAEKRYIICDIEASQKAEKRQPISLTLIQNSMWIGELKSRKTAASEEKNENLFAFKEETVDGEPYYSASFSLDPNIDNYFCMSFAFGTETVAEIDIQGYNETPLTIRIFGECVNPVVSFFKKGENTPIKQIRLIAKVSSDSFLEINSNVFENGVWYVNTETGQKIDYFEAVDGDYGSPYVFLNNGKYSVTVSDDSNGACVTEISWQEEYSA
jgi:hypothetical protein